MKKHRILPILLCLTLMISLILAAVQAIAGEPLLPGTESPSLAMQVHVRETNQALLTPHWSHADQAMHLSNPGKSQGMDLRMTMDRLHFKSSIQQENTRSSFPYTPEFGEKNLYSTDQDRMDWAAGIGYQWDLLNQRLSLIPMMGLSYHGHRQTPDGSLPPAAEPAPDKNALSEWNSWWFGLDLRAQPRPDLSVESSLLFHNARFSERNSEWAEMSETDIKNEGEGRIFRLGVRQQISPSWSAGILYSWQQWMAEKGELPPGLAPDDKRHSGIPFNGNLQELNISLSYGF
ncbi:hypothetical protein LZ24_02313 [Desulfobotulus alkaliphilus]|uniref:Protochlamydia outer membrane protein domain-containing protein n=1 Tax=Desulfobotulus alkaliphilus TaxID=622671 RepID=A0A562RN49_9BACT|nr:hypothetical protein [Desulfobotulus alkaliphilus]TWI70303.1 hypothetical protein LZ24_02313 [Desulfobotulus alkaliphilus]